MGKEGEMTGGSGTRTVMVTVPKEVEEVLLRIEGGVGVIGTVVTNDEGNVIRNTIDNALAEKAMPLLRELCNVATSAVRDLDPTNDMGFVRIDTRRYEMMVAPDSEFMITVFQNPL